MNEIYSVTTIYRDELLAPAVKLFHSGAEARLYRLAQSGAHDVLGAFVGKHTVN